MNPLKQVEDEFMEMIMGILLYSYACWEGRHSKCGAVLPLERKHCRCECHVKEESK